MRLPTVAGSLLATTLIAGCIVAAPVLARQPGVERSVVKVFVQGVLPDYARPWQLSEQTSNVGSGVVVGEGQVLTCAHVAAGATYIQVQPYGDPKKYRAELAAIGHDCDLALLTVADPVFRKEHPPLTVGDLPEVGADVSVYGFPIGGDKLSVTQGVISRVEVGEYIHSGRYLPLAQIDAAVNPGNSGGPVIVDGKIAGIAAQIKRNAQNIGYIVPPEVIAHFRRDAEDGVYDGFPSIGVGWQPIENAFQRARLGLAVGQTGVMVTDVSSNTSAWGSLREGDVIMGVEDLAVQSDGSVPFRGDDRLEFSWLLVTKRPGDTLRLSVLREGKEIETSLTLRVPRPAVERGSTGVPPSYFVFGGFVFTPLSQAYIDSFGFMDPPVELAYLEEYARATPERQQIVVLTAVLPNAVNEGYHELTGAVEAVNGKKVRDMRDLVAALEGGTGYVEILLADGWRAVLDVAAAKQANAEILRTFGVRSDRSDDLR